MAKIIEDMDNGFELNRYRDDTVSFEFFYPRNHPTKYIEVGISDVRASDGIRVSYNFERDGYVIEQPYFTYEQKEGYSQEVTHWKETAFVHSWALEEFNGKD